MLIIMEALKSLGPKNRPLIDIISSRKEESGFGEGRGECEGMLGGARVKLIQCRVNSLGETDPPQFTRGTWTERRPATKVSGAKLTEHSFNTHGQALKKIIINPLLSY